MAVGEDGVPQSGAQGSAGCIESGLLPPADTRMRPPMKASDLASLDIAYEVSRDLHWAANCRAERFGPMRISPLH